MIDGKGWRSGATIERRELPQWFLRITDYCEELLSGLEDVEWPEQVKVMQRNWIGRSEGFEIDFRLSESGETIAAYTTRPDTLFGATYMALAPEHPLVQDTAEKNVEMRAINRQIKLITKIDRAVKKIQDGTYGYCEETGEPIGIKRLIARPIATLCIDAQEKHEKEEKVYADI